MLILRVNGKQYLAFTCQDLARFLANFDGRIGHMIGKLTEFCKYLDIFCVLYTGGLTQHEISILCHSISQLNLLRFSENKWEDEVREQLCNKPKNSHKYIFHCIIFTDMFR